MRLATAILLAAAAAFSARAQPAEPSAPPQTSPAQAPLARPVPGPADDLIGSLLDPHHKPTAAEEEEPDTAGQARTAREPDLPLTAPATRTASLTYAPPPPRSQTDRPVHLEETGKTPDGPPSLRDMAYESRVRASFAAAEGFQGPLDGGWTLAGAGDGGDLYALQMVDKPGRLEGVWRDLRRRGALNASGLVDDIQRQGGQLVLRFAVRPGGPISVATLHADAPGRWRGDLEEDGHRQPVVLRRSGL